MHETMFEE